jgi:malonyl-CoA/methylmalonyl-CoA synthetase
MSDNHLLDTVWRPPSAEKDLLELPDGSTRTYGEVGSAAARIAHVLSGEGIEPGDRVVVKVEKSWETVPLYLGIIRAGAVLVPLNPAYTPAEVEYFVKDAEPSVFVDRDVLESLLAKAQDARELPAVERVGDDLAAILYTSGTTGRPKGAMLTHRNLASNTEALVQEWRVGKRDVLIHALPMFHTHGLFVAVNTILAAGGSLIFLPRFDTEEVLRLLPRATMLMGVPTFYVRLLATSGLDRERTRGMRLFVSGSAPLLPETHAAFRERTGHAILERYGMTETNMNTSNPYDGERRPGTVGFPLTNVELRIVRSDGSVPPKGEIGMIELRGPNVCAGYWRKPEQTREAWRNDGFFVTGDLGLVDERGYLNIVGRATDLIISGGLNVYPIEVESELDRLPGVAESAVVGLPHPDLGEGVTAVVIAQDGAAPTEAELLAQLRERLAPYKLPKRVVFRGELPRNAMGKVEKHFLRKGLEKLYG